MEKNEHKRVKHGQQPGDIPKKMKIAMREKKAPIVVWSWHTITEKAAKNYRRMLVDRSRTVQRRRDKRACEQGYEESEGL